MKTQDKRQRVQLKGTLAVAVVMNPAAKATCLMNTLMVGVIPDSLTATTKDGTTVTLNKAQLTHAATIIAIGARTDGVNRDAITIALMAALTESRLRMLSNTTAYPESANYPNDGDGSDHDSLGLFQMRHQTGWGTVEDLMDPTYQARAFYGGPTGPNHPHPVACSTSPTGKHSRKARPPRRSKYQRSPTGTPTGNP